MISRLCLDTSVLLFGLHISDLKCFFVVNVLITVYDDSLDSEGDSLKMTRGSWMYLKLLYG